MGYDLGLIKKELGLFTDLYELTMMQSYWDHGMKGPAVFSLYARGLPENWNLLVASGLESVLETLSKLHFSSDSLDYLRLLKLFKPSFLDFLKDFRFSGDVLAPMEGTALFPNEPLLQVRAPLMEAQLVETLVINELHFATLAASKGLRVSLAAAGRMVVDFSLRRIHGFDAALKGARCFFLAGIDATSNLLAGKVYGIPVSGTMAHSFIQAFDHEAEAFEKFVESYPEAILLVDTYHSLQGVKHVIELSRKMGSKFRVRGVRLDSGDLADLARKTRLLLDEAGLTQMTIFASGNLDEYEIERLVEGGAPIDGFGVGTRMGVSADRPYLDLAYKLVEYHGRPRMKLSPKKESLPGLKQVFRREEGGSFSGDEIALEGEGREGTPLYSWVMKGGKILHHPPSLLVLRETLRRNLAKFPPELQELRSFPGAYPVELSPGLKKMWQELRDKLE